MRGPLPPDQFAQAIDVPLERIERYLEHKLIDPDGDGLLDDYDVLRLAILQPYEDLDYTPEQITKEISESGHLPLSRIFTRGAGGYTLDEAAEMMGVTREQVEQICLAMGFPTDALLDQSDIDAFAQSRHFVDLGIPWEGIIEGARVYADALRRIAQAEITMTHRFLCERLEKQGVAEKDIMAAFNTAGPVFTELSNRLLKHLHEDFLFQALADHAVTHLDTDKSKRIPGALEATIVFVDLALFTSLAQAHGDELSAEILDRFDAIVRKRAVQWRGRLVKQIGDAFMLTFTDSSDAVKFSVAVIDAAAEEPDFPAVRVGIHSGPVLYRVGDYIGNTVNIASRVAAMAMPNVVLMTESVAGAARDAGIAVEDAGVRRVRGAEEPIAIYRAVAKRAAAQDPVCGMMVGDSPAAKLAHEGQEFVFCSQGCLRKFLDDPESYTAEAAS